MESDEDEYKDFTMAKQLSSFVMDDDLRSKEKIDVELKKLLSELELEYNLPEEYVRTFNLISFLKWRIGENESAFEFAKKARKRDNFNLVNLCNRIVFYYETGKHATFNRLLDELKGLQDREMFESEKVKALAEIAYSYSRLGPLCYEKAIEIFTDVIARTNPIANCLWEFGLALTMRRQAHMFNMREPKQFNPKKNNEQAAKHFLNVIQCRHVEDCEHLQAMSWCELGDIIHNKQLPLFCENVPAEVSLLSSSDCYEKATVLCPNNEFVLRKWGQNLRYSHKLKKSKDVLEKCLTIRDTPFTRHQLALTLMNMVTKCKGNHDPTQRANRQQCSENRQGEKYQDNRERNSHKYPMPAVPTIAFQKRFEAMRRSPKTIQTFALDPRLKDAVGHLKKALEISYDFSTARYDLGLIYMMQGDYENALDCFSLIVSDTSGRTCKYKITLVNAYEQQGLCKLQMASKEEDHKKKEDLKYEGEKSSWRAIEVAATVKEALPILKDTCHSFNTLKDLLSARTPPQTKELARLHKLLGHYKESIAFYKEVVNENKSDFKSIRQLIDNYIKEEDFDNAITTLSLLRCTQDSNRINKKMYIDTFINGAIKSLRENDTGTARFRFIQAFQIISDVRKCKCFSEDDCTCFDFLILHACTKRDSCKLAQGLKSLLGDFLGTRVTINSTDSLPFRPKIEYLKNTMTNSVFILAFFHFDDNDSVEIDGVIEHVLNMIPVKHAKKTLIISDGNVEHNFLSCKNIHVTLDSHDEKEPALQWKKDIILPEILYALFAL